jgi:hypothetical protein
MGATLLLRIAAMSPTMVRVPRRARSMFGAFVQVKAMNTTIGERTGGRESG